MNFKRENEKINKNIKKDKKETKISETDKIILLCVLLFVGILILVLSVGIQNIFVYNEEKR